MVARHLEAEGWLQQARLEAPRAPLPIPRQGELQLPRAAGLLRETIDELGRYTLERKMGVEHADHTINNKKRGLSKILKAAVASPGKRYLSTSRLVEEVRASCVASVQPTASQPLKHSAPAQVRNQHVAPSAPRSASRSWPKRSVSSRRTKRR